MLCFNLCIQVISTLQCCTYLSNRIGLTSNSPSLYGIDKNTLWSYVKLIWQYHWNLVVASTGRLNAFVFTGIQHATTSMRVFLFFSYPCFSSHFVTMSRKRYFCDLPCDTSKSSTLKVQPPTPEILYFRIRMINFSGQTWCSTCEGE